MTPVSNMAWAAGLFEGEGSIEVALPPRSRTGVRLHLNTTDKDVLERFAAVAGCGRVREVKAPSIVRPHWKTCWSWSAARQADCWRLLVAWFPYLGQRRAARAFEALELLEEKDKARSRFCRRCGAAFRAIQKGNQVYCSHDCQINRHKEAS